MPYTKTELNSNTFYKDFVNGLQLDYLKELVEYLGTNFRRNGVLYSFEDIETSNGIENANLSGLYSRHLGPNTLTEKHLELAKSSTNKKYPQYTKKQLLENTIDRNISELSESLFADSLPEDVANGDVVTNEDASDQRRWLIQDSQKRVFLNLGQYYGREYFLISLKTLNQSEIDAIPDGEPVE